MNKNYFLRHFCNSKKQEKAFIVYDNMLRSWQSKMNLVSRKSYQEVWPRHFIDSAQIVKYITPKNDITGIVDIGSGAGFPGLVVSLLGFEPVFLVESNKNKANFLNAVVRETGSSAVVFNEKIETVKLPEIDFVISRAFSSLKKLLDILDKKKLNNAKCIFPKGKSFKRELDETLKFWKMKVSVDQSETDSESKILILEAFKRV